MVYEADVGGGAQIGQMGEDLPLHIQSVHVAK
jgi:hypothetical protein